ncbi:hypothetical protein RhiJN_23150 [Ceratobasidium sp. AG-Ba]|nr:hypothetical protein RhiJN_23150 [Ceratobasidium sp. AG-Ba]
MDVDTTSIENQNATAKTKMEDPPKSPAPPSGIKEDMEFHFPDGNVYLRINGNEFFVHRYKLLEFRGMESMLEAQPESHPVLELNEDENDFRNTFRVLYASVSDFGAPVLASALRLATRYDHTALRKFAIDNLERMQLPPMDYLPLAREFNVVEWEKRALDHLAIRDEPITVAEASLLGTESFVAMIVRREQRLVQAAHLKSSQERVATPSTEPRATPDAIVKDAEEDVIDLSDAPDDQASVDSPRATSEPTNGEEPPPSDPSYPRTRRHLRQSLSGTPTSLNKQAAHQNGVAKKPGRKRKQPVSS